MTGNNQNKTTSWKIKAFYIDACNCDWGCPCQFMARPTHGNCDGFGGFLIREGICSEIRLDGLLAASVSSYPGPVHEGHGRRSSYIDERANAAQFHLLTQILTGTVGGPFEIYARTCDVNREPKKARFAFTQNGVNSQIMIDNVAKVELEPIKNPVTLEFHQAIIELPYGFEANRMEQASSKQLFVDDGFLNFGYSGTYASISEVEWNGS